MSISYLAIHKPGRDEDCVVHHRHGFHEAVHHVQDALLGAVLVIVTRDPLQRVSVKNQGIKRIVVSYGGWWGLLVHVVFMVAEQLVVLLQQAQEVSGVWIRFRHLFGVPW